MTPEIAHAWSQHYDSIQWTVTAILTAAIGGLLVYCTDDYDRWIAIVGLALTLASVFFASSFRSLRRHLNEFLEEHAGEDLQYLRSRTLFKQWPVHLAVHSLLLAAWLRLLLTKEPAYEYIWWIACTLVLATMIALAFLADQKPKNK